jgi:hypothetical protein
MIDIKELICEHTELELLIEAIEKQVKFCKNIAERPIQGYGSCSETMKKEKWMDKAIKLEAIQNKICQQYY